ncbi:MAG TPA: peroxiredoxin [Candidatus Dormibacteraeota bacterium]|nr:peroxiredoxin [Candidatus Dormibacteraeota bacterium]
MERGTLVADFELADETGSGRRLSELLSDGPLVLFFYPAAGSRGCSAEARHFRDLAADFTAVGAQVVGISTDRVAKQQKFAEGCSLGFPLLSDTQGTVAKEFGVKRRFGPIPVKRWTFVIGRDRRVLELIKSETNMRVHADRALAALRALPHS